MTPDVDFPELHRIPIMICARPVKRLNLEPVRQAQGWNVEVLNCHEALNNLHVLNGFELLERLELPGKGRVGDGAG